MPDLIQDFECLETPQQKKRFITRLGRIDLLIIDEWLGNKLYVRLGESTQCESVLNRILSKKVTIDCGSFNMRQYYSKKTPLY